MTCDEMKKEIRAYAVIPQMFDANVRRSFHNQINKCLEIILNTYYNKFSFTTSFYYTYLFHYSNLFPRFFFVFKVT